MRMLAFTAEISLYRTSGRYYMVAMWGSSAISSMVPAQLKQPNGRVLCGPCEEVAPGRWRHECDDGTMRACSPTVVCGSCLPDPNSPTGCSWECSYQNARYTGPSRYPCACPPRPNPPYDPCFHCSWFDWLYDPFFCGIAEATCICTPAAYLTCWLLKEFYCSIYDPHSAATYIQYRECMGSCTRCVS
jgi:hypothetical protein